MIFITAFQSVCDSNHEIRAPHVSVPYLAKTISNSTVQAFHRVISSVMGNHAAFFSLTNGQVSYIVESLWKFRRAVQPAISHTERLLPGPTKLKFNVRGRIPCL